MDGVTGTEPTGPVIISHVDGQQVSGAIEVTVTSTAPEVLVAWADEINAPWDGPRPTVTDDGLARTVLATSGFEGATTIVARDCT